jgi:hypothetical protein
MKWLPKDGRLVALIIICAYALLLCAGIRSADGDRITIMQKWFGVPAMEPLFADLRHVTAAWDAQRAGLSPEEPNPYDDFRRPFTYPKLWLVPGVFGLTSKSTLIIAIVTIAVFLLVAFWSFGRLTIQEGIIAGVFLTGPPIICALERCNVELWVFGLVAAGVLLGRQNRLFAPALQLLCLLVATMAKLHPVGSFLCLLRESLNKTLIAMGVFFGAVALYFSLTFSDIRRITQLLPQVDWFSYGGRIGFEYGVKALQQLLRLEMPPWLVGTAYLLIICFVIFITWFVFSKSTSFFWQRFGDVTQSLFLAGGGVFVFSFVALKSYEYRYIFLLLCLPLLFSMARRKGRAAAISWLTLSTIFVLFYDSELYGLLPAAVRSGRYVNWFFTVVGLFGSWVLFVLMLTIIGGLVRSWFSSVTHSVDSRLSSTYVAAGDLL